MNTGFLKYLLPLSFIALIGATVTGAVQDASDRLSASLSRLKAKADCGDPEAIFRLARLYETGYDSIPPDTLRSLELYRDAARRGYSPAENYYGFLLFKGLDGFLEAQPDSAIIWIEKAAQKGDAKAANNLGWLYMEGECVSHDPDKAAKWFSQAAESGLPAAKAQLADLYREGKGVDKDTLRAENLYLEAIAGGIPDAEDKLVAMMHKKYTSLSPEEALTKGLRLYLNGAPWGGVILFETAAETGSCSPAGAKALALLGDAYSRAKGVGYDHDRSINLFHRAAVAGNPSAMFIVAEFLDLFPDSFSCAEETETAQEWYEKAKAAGITDAKAAYDALYKIPAPSDSSSQRRDL